VHDLRISAARGSVTACYVRATLWEWITFSFYIRRCTSTRVCFTWWERWVCCSVMGSRKRGCPEVFTGIRKNCSTTVLMGVEKRGCTEILTVIRKCNCTSDLTGIRKCNSAEVLTGIIVVVLKCWRELGSVAVLKFSTEVRKCASARVLKQIRKRTTTVDRIG